MAKTKTQNPDSPPATGSPGDDLVATMAATGVELPVADQSPADSGDIQPDIGAAQPAAPLAAQAAPSSSGAGDAGQQPAQPSFLDRVRELGFENVSSEQEAMQRLIDAQGQNQQQIQQLAEMARYGQEYAELAQDPAFQQFYSQRQATPSPIRHASVPQQPPASPQAGASGAPDWCPIPSVDLNLIQRFREVRLDPTSGQQVADFKPNTPLQIRQQYEQYVAGVEQFTNELTTNPRAVLNRYRDAEVMPAVRQIIQEELGRVSVQQTQQSLSMRIATENPWLFARDARTGGVLQDPATGQAMLTNEGQQAYEMLQSLGSQIRDPAQAWELTRSYVMTSNPHLAQQYLLGGNQAAAGGPPAAPPSASPQPPAAAARVVQRNYLQAAAAASSTPPNRTGSLDQPGTTQQRPGRRKSAGQDLLETMAAMGVPVDN